MGLAVQLLRHLRRRHFLSPVSVTSISTPLQSSPVKSHLFPGPQAHDLFLAPVSSRSFSWFSNPSKSGDNELNPYRSSEILESDVEPHTSTTGATQIENGSETAPVTEDSIWDHPAEFIAAFLDGYHDLTGLPW